MAIISKVALGNIGQRVGPGLACRFIWPAIRGPLVTLIRGKPWGRGGVTEFLE